ncbi:MAG: phospho-N-acetylmuramoyl-pentapeptide-transferase [Candidatus Marinimicrobia bacterium]|nr:phospho-N-acetylmuramoyl-pentapeptide-transferase [Candidatus Neomarinimicrobiota bacterium]|tara:strand:+ start:915 stop:2018 length:1104 start_codon:yes stop_codon:yes gene_type:complete
MFYHILYPLRSELSGLNIFQYITFRAAGAAITALIISFLMGPWVIRKLRAIQILETIGERGPQSHQSKKGTPTMGGIIILAAVIFPTLLWANLLNSYIHIILLATVWMGLFGFLDDYLKTVKKTKKGLVARYKLAGQIGLGIMIGAWIFYGAEFREIGPVTSVPFFKNLEIPFGILYIPWVTLVLTASSNAVNLTDGLDGLAAGLLAICALALAVISYISGRIDFSDYLNIIYLPKAGELTIFAASLAGACLGFLWFNAPPAQVFMGDTGALSSGAALGTLAILLKKELLLLILGGVFVWEAVSVMIQLGYFRWSKRRTGEAKRFFLMAPIHHHFELKGWKETQVVIRFWIIGILFALMTISTFKIR